MQAATIFSRTVVPNAKNKHQKLKNMKTIYSPKALHLLVVLLASTSLFAQNITVDPSGTQATPAQQLKPGFFYNNTNAQANAFFDASTTRYNMLRTFDVAFVLRISTGFNDFMVQLQNLQAIHENRAARTDILVIMIMALPQWLSSSTDSSLVSADDNLMFFEAVKPGDYNLYDSTITAMANVIKTWDLTPYFEFWNEPELQWKGTEAELIEMYTHTAIAIKAADPTAKVGGLGANGWANGTAWLEPPRYGYIPDSLADQMSMIGHLIDSAAANNVPLDFVSWHAFGGYWKPVEWAKNYFTNKLNSYGMTDVELLITEYNVGGSMRETVLQPSMFVKCFRQMEISQIDGHSMAAFQDFVYDPILEFFGGWGAISRGGLAKPVYHAIALIDYLQRGGQMLNVQTLLPITTMASLHTDTLRVLISNHVFDPLSAGYEALLYGDFNVNLTDLALAGYVGFGQIDSTIAGLLTPMGSPNVLNAFAAANVSFNYSLSSYYQNTNIQLKVEGSTGTTQGRLFLIDSVNNNIIHKYDSLINAGYTRALAVATLYSVQTFDSDSIVMTGNIFSFEMEPNAVVLVEFYDINITATPSLTEILDNVTLSPNPSAGVLTLNAETSKLYSVAVYTTIGQLVYSKTAVWDGQQLDLSILEADVYIIIIASENDAPSVHKLVIQ